MEIIEFLERNKSVKVIDILDFKTFRFGFFIKVKVVLINESELFIREYSDKEVRNYSYHWQDKNGKLIIRWDNSPHHKNISTFPHHKHNKNKIIPSFEIDISGIFKIIEKNI
ncbi:MAG: DUF6516 family protein [Spirochaetota bacterium]